MSVLTAPIVGELVEHRRWMFDPLGLIIKSGPRPEVGPQPYLHGAAPPALLKGQNRVVGVNLGGGEHVCLERLVDHGEQFGGPQHPVFDIGVFHSREAWIRDAFGGAEGEGTRFVLSEMTYLVRHAPWLIPSSYEHFLSMADIS